MSDGSARDEVSSCAILIPARYASTRFPGKPLAKLRGPGGTERSLIEWSWRAALSVPDVTMVAVATDDRRIADEVERFGGQVIMTPSECANGTERCAAAIGSMSDKPDIVVNFQGDAPLTPSTIVRAVIARLAEDAELAMATPAIACRPETLHHLIEDRKAGRVGGTTTVFDARHRALYFSKEVLPRTGTDGAAENCPVHLHLGIYAYRPEALASYMAAPPSALELAEGLEQLRFLDIGLPVGVVICDPPEGLMIELNNPTDASLIEHELQQRGS